MARIRQKNDESIKETQELKTQVDAAVAALGDALGIKLRLHRIDEPFQKYGELRYNRFYCLALPVPGASDMLFPRTKNPNEIKRVAATITDMIHMGFIKGEVIDDEADAPPSQAEG